MALTSIEVSFELPKFSDAMQRKFDHESWHLREIFTSWLRDQLNLELDGLDNLTIAIVGSPLDCPYRKEVTKTWNGSTIAMGRFHFVEFDVAGFFALSQSERAAAIVDLLDKSVSQLASVIGAETLPIHQAAEFTRQCGPKTIMIAPKRWPWADLRPEATTESGAFRGRLVREVGQGHCQWKVEILDSAGESLTLVDVPGVDAERLFRYAVCDGNLFRLLDQSKNVTFEVDLAASVGSA